MRVCFYILLSVVMARIVFGIPEALWWYFMISATVTGLTTYLGLLSYNVHKTHFFVKYNLEPVFVAFCFIGPLIELPSILARLSDFLASGGEAVNGFFWALMLAFVGGGQLYFLLIPVQILLCRFKGSLVLKTIGNMIVLLGVYNIAPYFVLMIFYL